MRLTSSPTLLFCLFLHLAGCGRSHIQAVDTADEALPQGTEVSQSSDGFGTNSAQDTEDPNTGVDAPGDNPNAPNAVPPGEDVGPCESLASSASNVMLPLDIIWVIDGSPSMDNEIAIIEANMNAFTASIGASGLDYRVVLIGADHDYYDPGAAHSYNGICIPPPLNGSDGCPDTNSERFFHVRRGVHSHDAIEALISTYPEYQHFLRPDAITHFVAVSDDDTGYAAGDTDFNAFIDSATQPGFPSGITFHSIIDLVGYDPSCIWDDSCSCGEKRGQNYINLSEQTGGMVYSLCEEDWEPIFETLQENVIVGTAMPCDYQIPVPEMGLGIDPEQTNVVLVSEDGLTRDTLYNVPNADACSDLAAWYFDTAIDPTMIHLCPSACGAVSGTVEIEFGCETVKY